MKGEDDMCSFGGSRPAPPPPPPPEVESESAKDARKRARQDALAEKTKLKDEAYEQRVASVYGKRGRKSLLTGTRQGGSGFALDSSIMSKDTLGA
tara:strand:- start:7048 stop:7332 length:285 start_codon:yes stop_codon:yes gene_type:complete